MAADPGSKRAGRKDRDFYQSWRQGARKWAKKQGVPLKLVEYGLAAPDLLHLVTRLLADSRVPAADKARLAIAAAYLASPIDLLPEILFGPVGVLDDVAIVAWALRGLLGPEHREVIKEHWAGDQDVVEVLTGVLDAATGWLSSMRLDRLRGAFSAAAKALRGGPGGAGASTSEKPPSSEDPGEGR